MSKKKPIGLWSAVSIGIGGMIGGGIFSVLGVATEIAGNAICISFMIAGIVCLHIKCHSRVDSGISPIILP